MLICPYTGARLRRARVKGGFLWYSPESGGRLLSVAMVRHYLDQHAAQELWMRSENAKANTERPCPSCQKPMRTVTEPGWIGPYEIDVCRRCYVMWFDQYEHMEIPHPHVDLDENVQQIERQVAHKEVEVDAEQVRAEKERFFGEGPEALLKQMAAFFLLPVEMEPPAEPKFPLITAILCVTMLLLPLIFSFGQEMVETFGFVPANGFGLTAFLFPFGHAGLIHMLGNVYFLGMFGDDVEEDLGFARYIVLVLTIMAGSAASLALFSTKPEIPVIGASALVFGLMTYYALRFPKVRMAYLIPVVHHLNLAPGAFARVRGLRWIRMPIWAVYLFYIAFNFGAYFLLERKGYTRISHLGHISGAAIGLLMFVILSPRRSTEN